CVLELAGDVGRRPERRQRVGGLPTPVTRIAKLEEDLGAFLWAVDSELQRGAQPRRRLVEGQRGDGRPSREHVVLDCTLGATEGRGGGEVMREIGERPAGARLGGLERLSHPKMKLRSPYPREPVVERPPDELVREAPGQAA